MLMKDRLGSARRDGFRQGMWTGLLIASPFIIAGAKWMMENFDPLMKRVKGMKQSDVYTQLFDRNAHREKEANKKLDNFRSAEGNFGNYDVEASNEEDEALFHMIKEITKNELNKRMDG